MNINCFIEFMVWDKDGHADRAISINPDVIEWFQASDLHPDLTEMGLRDGDVLLIKAKYPAVKKKLDGLVERVRGFENEHRTL